MLFATKHTCILADLIKALFEVTVTAFMSIPKAKISRLLSLILPLNLMLDISEGIEVTSGNISIRLVSSSARCFSVGPPRSDTMSWKDLKAVVQHIRRLSGIVLRIGIAIKSN